MKKHSSVFLRWIEGKDLLRREERGIHSRMKSSALYLLVRKKLVG